MYQMIIVMMGMMEDDSTVSGGTVGVEKTASDLMEESEGRMRETYPGDISK